MHKTKKAVFILTTVRSGSTLLRIILDQHSKCFSPPELNLLPYHSLIDREKQFKGTTLTSGLKEAIQKVLETTTNEAEKIYDEFVKTGKTGDEIYAWLFEQTNAQILIDKSPLYGWVPKALNTIESKFDAPLYIHLIRHPSAVMESIIRNRFDKLIRMVCYNGERAVKELNLKGAVMLSNFMQDQKTKDNPQRLPWDVAEASWHNINKNITNFLAEIPSDRQIQVRYEDMVGNTQDCLQKIGDFMNITLEEKMLNPYSGFDLDLSKEATGDPNITKHSRIIDFTEHWREDVATYSPFKLRNSTVKFAKQLGYNLLAESEYIPLSPAQKAFFDAYESNPNYFLVTIFQLKVKQEIALDWLNEVLNILLIDQTVLRCCFKNIDGVWYHKLDSDCNARVIFHDMRGIPNAEIAQKIDDCKKSALDNIKVDTAPLFSIVLFQMDNQDYRILYLFHHLITDGFSLLMFHRNLWKMYEKGQPSKQASEDNYKDYIYQIEDIERKLDKEVEKTRWEKISGTSVFSLPKENKYEKSLFANQMEYVCTFDLKKMPDIGLKKQFHFLEIAIALYKALAKWTDQSQVVVAHRLNRRNIEEVTYNQTMGWLAGDIPIVLDVDKPLPALKKELKKVMQEVKKRNIMYELLSNTKVVPKAHEICPVRLNYFPFVQKTAFETIAFTDMSSTLHFASENERDYAIDFIVRERDHVLKVIVRYDKKQYEETTITGFVDMWRAQLYTMINLINYDISLR